jgi:hypothetical protein
MVKCGENLVQIRYNETKSILNLFELLIQRKVKQKCRFV